MHDQDGKIMHEDARVIIALAAERNDGFAEIEERLRKACCPDEVIARHMARLRNVRRVKRKQIIRKRVGRGFETWIVIDGKQIRRCRGYPGEANGINRASGKRSEWRNNKMGKQTKIEWTDHACQKVLSKQRPEWPTAIHEAGHAVIARVLGIEVEEVVIALAPPSGEGRMRLTEYGLGGVQMRAPRKYDRVMSWYFTAHALLAGRIAQARACPGSLDPEVAGGVLDSDLAHVAELTRKYALLTGFGIEPVPEVLSAPQERELWRCRKRFRRETRILVDKHWLAIERVAEALLSGGVLDGDEVDALIGRWRED
jgi:hypothetical protein